jgi:hypothetical protein
MRLPQQTSPLVQLAALEHPMFAPMHIPFGTHVEDITVTQHSCVAGSQLVDASPRPHAIPMFASTGAAASLPVLPSCGAMLASVGVVPPSRGVDESVPPPLPSFAVFPSSAIDESAPLPPPSVPSTVTSELPLQPIAITAPMPTHNEART